MVEPISTAGAWAKIADAIKGWPLWLLVGILPQYTLPVSATILIRGVPKQKSDVMNATIEIADADANEERVRVKLQCINALHVKSRGAESAGERGDLISTRGR